MGRILSRKISGVHSGIKSLAVVVSFGAAGLSFAAPVNLPQGVAVIDEGVDLDHKVLKPNVELSNGTIDPDFKDERAGWNVVSNNPNYFPTYVKSAFTSNAATVTMLFEQWSKVENGDETAKAFFKDNPRYYRLVSMLLQKSHGTHVAGIAVTRSEQSARLKSLNVFTKDETTPAAAPTPGGPTPAQLLSLVNELRVAEASDEDPVDAEGKPSFFDDKDKIEAVVSKIEEKEANSSALIAKYVQRKGMGVANLSLGSAYATLRQRIENVWEADVRERGLPPGTTRNVRQQANFDLALNGIFAALKKSWVKVFSENPNTLFVVAAGNDGDPKVTDKGNNDVSACLPAVLSMELDNVITVAASDKDGTLTDFSNYGVRSVNIAALGKAVQSAAPGDNNVAMSGTSMAAPFVAGVAAEVRKLNPELSAAQTRRLLEQTGRKLDALKDKISTGAVVDPPAAYAAARTAHFWGLDTAIMLTLKARENAPFGDIKASDLRRPESLMGNRVSALMERHLVRASNGRSIASSSDMVRDMVKRLAR